MYSAYDSPKQGWQYRALSLSFPSFELVNCSLCGPNSCILTHLMVVSTFNFSRIAPHTHFFVVCLFVFSIWTHMFSSWDFYQCPSQSLSSFPFFFFFNFAHLIVFHLFLHFYLHLISSFFVSVFLLLVPFKVLLISVIALIITAWLFFISCSSMVNIFISSQSGPSVYLMETSLSF